MKDAELEKGRRSTRLRAVHPGVSSTGGAGRGASPARAKQGEARQPWPACCPASLLGPLRRACLQPPTVKSPAARVHFFVSRCWPLVWSGDVACLPTVKAAGPVPAAAAVARVCPSRNSPFPPATPLPRHVPDPGQCRRRVCPPSLRQLPCHGMYLTRVSIRDPSPAPGRRRCARARL